MTVHHTGTDKKYDLGVPLKQRVLAFQKLTQGGYDIEQGGHKTWVFAGDIPYHYFMDETGAIAAGRDLSHAAHTNTTYLTPIAKHITVVLQGNFQTHEPSERQLDALVDLLAKLAAGAFLSVRYGTALSD